MNISPPIVLLAACLCAQIMIATGGNPRNPHLRAWMCIAGLCGTAIYMLWRLATLSAIGSGPGSAWFILLTATEFLCLCSFIIFLVLVSRYTDRIAEADAGEARLRSLPEEGLPPVDVFVTTYNEDWEVLEKTIVGALALDYPKKTVWVLDDGRRAWLAEQCERLGAIYITRQDNRHRKAGNHNNALRLTDAPFIAVMDADFVPFPNFIWRVLGLFHDPSVGIVQTPQTFYNPDPLLRNLWLQRIMPDELRFFYNSVSPSRDAWDVTFYVGSCAMLRRRALESVGGIAAGLDTEDQVTSILLLQHGWVTRYLNETLTAGLAPESNFALFEQRKRWCRGSLQILYSRFGPFGRGLKPHHRIFFLQEWWILAFLSPFVFLSTLVLAWVTDADIFPLADEGEMLAMPILSYLMASLTLAWISERTYLPIISYGIQIFFAFRLAPTVIGSLIKPFGKPLIRTIHVTPKGDQAGQGGRVDWITLTGVMCFVALILWGMIDQLLLGGYNRRPLLELIGLITWTLITLPSLAIAALACVEPSYRRAEERFAMREPAQIVWANGRQSVTLRDLSLVGARLDPTSTLSLPPGTKIRLVQKGFTTMRAEIVRCVGQEIGVHLLIGSTVREQLIRRLFNSERAGGASHGSVGQICRGLVTRFGSSLP